MEKTRKTKMLALSALFVAIFSVAIAFAAMSTTLNINGTAEMKTASWDIKFENLSVGTAVGAGEFTTNPSIQSDTTIGNYMAKLTKPGDEVSFAFDITNNGTIDAKLTSLLTNGTTGGTPVCTGVDATTGTADATIVCGNLSYTMQYTSDYSNVAENDTLAAGTSKTIQVTLSYNGSTLPANDVNITGLEITFVYSQD